MGGLFDAIGDFFGAVIGAVWDAICDIMDAVWQFISHNIFEPIMNFLGFEDETIYITDVVAVKVMQESILPRTTTEAVIKKVTEGINILDYLGEFDAKGNTQFNKYFRKGKNDYVDHLPECQINAVSIPTAEFKTILERELGTTVDIQDILVGVPFDVYWCKYQLQEQYNYNISTDSVFINDVYYVYANDYYNTSTNKFEVILSNITSVKEKIYETESVFVAGTTDVVEEQIIENEDGTTETIEVTVTKEIKRTLKYQRSIFQRTDTGAFLHETEDALVSSEDELVDVGTTVTSTRFYLLTTREVEYDYNPLTVVIDNHNNERSYTVKYIRENNNRVYLWVYNPSSDIYPELSAPVDKIVGFETYPIVMIRNSFFDVDEYDINSKNIDGEIVSRPPTITKERYDDTVEMVSSLSIKLSDLIDGYSDNPDVDKMQDTFFGLSISPSNTSEIVSKVLYEIFDFIYDELPPINTSEMYAASFKENPFNAAITWLPKAVEVYEGKIGDVGFCRHTISDMTYRGVETTETTYKHLSGSRWGITTKVVRKVYRGDELVSEYTDTETYREEVDYDSVYNEGTYVTVNEDSTENSKDATIECQLTANTVKRLTLHKLEGFHIVRRGVTNGGVTLPIDNKNFTIPIPVPVVERLSIIEKTALLSEAVYMIFYAYDEQHLRWYETEKFMDFLQIIIIAIIVIYIIYTWDFKGGLDIGMILMSLLKVATWYIIIQVTLKFIASTNWSPQLKATLSAVAVLAGAAFGGAFNIDIVMTALTLTAITANAVSIYIGEQVKDLQEDTNSVYSKFETRNEYLSEVRKSQISGIDTGFVTELALIDNASPYQFRVYTVDQWRYMMIDACKDFDRVFENAVTRATNNRNNLHATY